MAFISDGLFPVIPVAMRLNTCKSWTARQTQSTSARTACARPATFIDGVILPDESGHYEHSLEGGLIIYNSECPPAIGHVSATCHGNHGIGPTPDALLGMEVRGPRYDLRQALDTQISARAMVHTFSQKRFLEALAEGFRVVDEVKQRAHEAFEEHSNRRVWLFLSLVPILMVVVLLILYIRTLPLPAN